MPTCCCRSRRHECQPQLGRRRAYRAAARFAALCPHPNRQRLCALRHRERFEGRAQLKTWLFAILKNKITDYLRQKQRENKVFAETPAETELDELYEAQFDSSGHWHEGGIDFNPRTPEQDLEGRQFQSVFQACLYGLPENTARVFMLREVMGWDAGEIQSHCGISAANYYTIMHRAREGLRQCLQIKWFNHR